MSLLLYGLFFWGSQYMSKKIYETCIYGTAALTLGTNELLSCK
jgi:hypothetical protein